MRDLLVLLIVTGSLPLIFMRPYVGVLMWSWLGYMNPHRLTWGFAYDLPFAQLVGLVTILALIFNREKSSIPKNPLVVTWILFIVWMNFTTLLALNPDSAMIEWDRTMKIQLFSFITIWLINDRERLNLLAIVIACSIGFFGFKGGIFAIGTGGSYRVYGPAGSFIRDNNALGLAMVMVTPLMWYLYMQARRRMLRLAILGGIGLTLLSILTTHSRGAFLAIAAMLVFLWFKSRYKGMLTIVLLVGAPMLLLSMPDHWKERMWSIKDYQADGSAMGRINAWQFAINLASDRPIGGGYRTFTETLFQEYAPEPDQFHDAHSIYFEVLGEHGFIGLFLFLLLGVLGLTNAGWVARHARDGPGTQWAADLGAMLQVALVGYAISGAFLGLAYFDLYYHLLAMIVILRSLVESALATQGNDVEADDAEPDVADDDVEAKADTGAGQKLPGGIGAPSVPLGDMQRPGAVDGRLGAMKRLSERGGHP